MGFRRKLNSEQIQLIRQMSKSGKNTKEIAVALEVTTPTVRVYLKYGSLTRYNNLIARRKGYTSHYQYSFKKYGNKPQNNELIKEYNHAYLKQRDKEAKEQGYRNYKHFLIEQRKAFIGRIIAGVIQTKSQLEEKIQEKDQNHK